MLRRRRLHALFVAAVLALAPLGNAAEAAERLHTVYKGQTLGRIAKRYNTTVAVLREVNDLRPGQPLRPGLVLVIPEKGKEAEAAKRAAAIRGRSEAGKKGAKDPKDAKDEKLTKGKGKDGDRAKGKAQEDARGKERETVGKPEKYVKKPKRPGFVKLVRGTEHLETQVITKRGRLVPGSLPGVSKMLSFTPTGAKIPIDPRLVTLLGMVSDHFGGRPVHIVSGYRPFSPRQYTRHSKHNVGHAVDFSIEGVPNTVLRDFCRTFRNAGVGYYPNSTFVHLDVRTTKVYWVDYSRPGEAPRYNTPKAHLDADESASEVLPSEAGGGDGSHETQDGDKQPVDPTGGNPDTAGSGAGNPAGGGPSRPAPPAAPPAGEKAPPASAPNP